MIHTEAKNQHIAENPDAQVVPAELPVSTRMARKMVELTFCGITVNTDALATAGFTIAEINAHWEAARDEATIMQRDNVRAA